MYTYLKKFFLLTIRIYQVVISPLFGQNACRLVPTCSFYMYEAINRYGILNGLALGTKRIFHCHPWGVSGFDPVP